MFKFNSSSKFGNVSTMGFLPTQASLYFGCSYTTTKITPFSAKELTSLFGMYGAVKHYSGENQNCSSP